MCLCHENMWLRIGERTYLWHHQWEERRADNGETPWVSTCRQALWNQGFCYACLFNMTHSLTKLPSGYGALVPLKGKTSSSLVTPASGNGLQQGRGVSPAKGFNHYNSSKGLQNVHHLNSSPLKQKKSGLWLFLLTLKKRSRIQIQWNIA